MSYIHPKINNLSTEELQFMYCYYFYKVYNRYPTADEYPNTSSSPKRDVLLAQCKLLGKLSY